MISPGLRKLDLRTSGISKLGALKKSSLQTLQMKTCKDPKNLLFLKRLQKLSLESEIPEAILLKLKQRSVVIQ